MNVLIILTLLLLMAAARFTIGAVFSLSRRVYKVSGDIHDVLSLLHAMKIRQEVEDLNSLKQSMREAVKSDDFEAAKHFDKLINDKAKSIEDEVNRYNERYGDVAEISVEKVRGER